mmetsp:Transcript_17323/g.27004  ORF Transcript_17323/g.27004 Transcript_17323/m.27004 type:complete len:498 (-) Transcript_17323:306-1799(-)
MFAKVVRNCRKSLGAIIAQRRISFCVIGSGPSGFYAAKYLKAQEKQFDTPVTIDIFERLPTPYGLVRSGVAPDHPEVKNVEHDFADVMVSNKESIRFLGNVHVGRDIQIEELRVAYDAIILAYGCESDKQLPESIHGTHLSGIMSAREFVAWYNSHPDFVGLTKEIGKFLSNECHVVIIGQGNVALDCARILGKGSKGLQTTDIGSHFMSMPSLNDGVCHTSVIGRRGHVQGAFTIKELRELSNLKKEGHDVQFYVREEELAMGSNPSSMDEIANSRPKTRIDKLLRNAATVTFSSKVSKTISLRFLLTPVEFLPRMDDPSRVGSVVLERTKLEGEPGKQVAVGTGVTEVIPADFVLTSIGYRGMKMPGLENCFDDRKGVVKNFHGKIESENGIYVTGWLKRGPSGIIGTNIADAKDTVATIIADYKNGILKICESKVKQREQIESLLAKRSVDVVDWQSFEKIDLMEKNRNRLRTDLQPREKFSCVNEMLKVAKSE